MRDALIELCSSQMRDKLSSDLLTMAACDAYGITSEECSVMGGGRFKRNPDFCKTGGGYCKQYLGEMELLTCDDMCPAAPITTTRCCSDFPKIFDAMCTSEDGRLLSKQIQDELVRILLHACMRLCALTVL